MMMCNGPLALGGRSAAAGADEASGFRDAIVEARYAGERRTVAAPYLGSGVTARWSPALSQKARAGAPEAPIRMTAVPAARIKRIRRKAPNPCPLRHDLAAHPPPQVHNRLQAWSFRREKRFTRRNLLGARKRAASTDASASWVGCRGGAASQLCTGRRCPPARPGPAGRRASVHAGAPGGAGARPWRRLYRL